MYLGGVWYNDAEEMMTVVWGDNPKRIVYKSPNILFADQSDITKNLELLLSGISTATKRQWTVQDADGTVPLLESIQTFTAAQIISPSTGIPLTLIPASGEPKIIDINYTDSAYVGGTTINLTPILNNVAGINIWRGINIQAGLGDIIGGGLIGINASITGNSTAGTPTIQGLNFTGTAGSGNWSSVTGSLVNARQGSTGTITTLTGVQSQLTTVGSGLGNIAIAQGYNTIVSLSGGLTATDVYGYRIQTFSAGGGATITNAYGLMIPAFGGAGTYGTTYGIRIGNQTKGTTNWAIYSEGADSVHVGNFRLGSTAAPTAQLSFADAKDIDFGTTTGTRIGTATSQKFAFWNTTPVVQPTTAIGAATLVGGGGVTLTDTDTFDGYTLLQVVAALRLIGILA